LFLVSCSLFLTPQLDSSRYYNWAAGLEAGLTGALVGVRVIDFTEYVAGPYAGQMLADMGATVTKFEPPQGDFWRLTNMVAADESRGFISVNRGKRSISIDLKTDAGQEIVRRAVVDADVVLSSYRPGVAKRLNVDYEALSALNPRLIYGENSAFGSEGPYSQKTGFDLVSQAMTGIIAFESQASDMPHSITTAAITDFLSGMFMAYAVVNALYHREHTGEGQKIDTSLFASGLAMQYRPLLSIEVFDAEPRRALLELIEAGRSSGKTVDEVMQERISAGFERPGAPAVATNPYYNIYKTRTGYMVIACLNNRLRRAAASILGVEDARLEMNEWDSALLDTETASNLNTRIIEVFQSKTTEEWLALFEAVGVPCGQVRETEELYDDPQVAAQGLVVDFDHPIVGPIRAVGSPIRMTKSDTVARTPSPALGQHTREVLSELGYTPDEIEAMIRGKAVKAM
jgi:crotonobetainyl-CoA:carnitine CoA-transferase CaiB-like acyl-CoA transferase